MGFIGNRNVTAVIEEKLGCLALCLFVKPASQKVELHLKRTRVGHPEYQAGITFSHVIFCSSVPNFVEVVGFLKF